MYTSIYLNHTSKNFFSFQKEDKNKRLTTVVLATRSARAINGGEDGDGM